MAADRTPAGAALPAELSLLLFRAAGAALGVEAAAVEGILDAGVARSSGIRCRRLGELLRAPGPPGAAEGTVLVFRGREEPYGVGIDGLDDVVSLPTTALQPLPGILRAAPGPRAYWGGFVRSGKVVLLVDVDRLRETAAARTAACE